MSSTRTRVDVTTLQHARELRHNMTRQERILWRHLRGKRLYGLKFRRQHPYPPYILDFFCHQYKLVIEIDGSQHTTPEQEAYDQQRTDWLQAQGLRVLRFTNREVNTQLEGVLTAIAYACGIES